jgi:hypothetical protein
MKIQGAVRRRRAKRGRSSESSAAMAGESWLVPLLVNPMEGRTGSTLLMRLLGTSPLVAFDRVYPFENRYLTYLVRLVEHMAQPPGSVPGWDVGALLEGSPNVIGPLPFKPELVNVNYLQASATRHLWRAFSESVRATGKGDPERYYAEKSWGRSLELLDAAEIPCRVVNLVRDPRDVVASIRAFDARRGFFGFGRVDGQSDAEYLDWILATIKRNLAAMTGRPADEDTTWVRYEDLVSDTSAVAERLSEWLGVELSAAAAQGPSAQYRRHATTGAPGESIGRWRTDLSDRDARQVELVLGEEMTRLGYLD